MHFNSTLYYVPVAERRAEQQRRGDGGGGGGMRSKVNQQGITVVKVQLVELKVTS